VSQADSEPSAADDGERLRRLVERIAAGEPAAEAELAERFDRRVRAMMAVRTRDRDAAQDLAQETLIAVLGALRQGQLREAERLPAFVHGTARNVLNNYFRRRQQQPLAVRILARFREVVPSSRRLLRAGRLAPDVEVGREKAGRALTGSSIGTKRSAGKR
jgi:DNA-directed RNA polymerase specialized sigma24 family protein